MLVQDLPKSVVPTRCRLPGFAPSASSLAMRLVIPILIVVLIGGGLWYLSTMNSEKPLTRVEKTIPNEKLGK
jgi:hypothetical protein